MEQPFQAGSPTDGAQRRANEAVASPVAQAAVVRNMSNITRRVLVAALAASGRGRRPGQWPPRRKTPAPPDAHRFSHDDVITRARDLASAPFDATVPPLPPELAQLDFDAWRDIRFRPEKAFLGEKGGKSRLQAFHLGHLFKRPVTINIVRDGAATPIPYTANLFDYGRSKFDKPLPSTGFAGFRIHYPLNALNQSDELISFLVGVISPQAAASNTDCRRAARRSTRVGSTITRNFRSTVNSGLKRLTPTPITSSSTRCSTQRR